MDFMGHIVQAWSNLVTAKLRSFLAVLGILVGTGAVVALVTSTQLSTNYELSKFKALGTNLISLSIMSVQSSSSSKEMPELHLSDMRGFYKASKQIKVVAPYTQVFSGGVSFKGSNFPSAMVLGVTGDFYSILKISVARGRYVSLLDGINSYCMIGHHLAETIRQAGTDPLGAKILVNGQLLTVVGVLKPHQRDMFLYMDIDNAVILSVPASRYLSAHTAIQNVLFRLTDQPDLSKVKHAVSTVMNKKLPGQHIYLRDPQQILDVISKAKRTSSILLTAIGAISLLVGAIGVMNIMLVSVIERRREIGIRIAIGAKRRDILKMFLIESIVLTVFGGLLGVVSGVGVSYMLAESYHWGFSFYWLPPLLGFSVSVLVGVLSGYYPALKASRLDPIEILRG
jgi:putative ABC transport system permease protein